MSAPASLPARRARADDCGHRGDVGAAARRGRPPSRVPPGGTLADRGGVGPELAADNCYGDRRREHPGPGPVRIAGGPSCRGRAAAVCTGAVQFRTLDLMVDRRVLIPRPETEQVVEAALGELDRVAAEQPART